MTTADASAGTPLRPLWPDDEDAPVAGATRVANPLAVDRARYRGVAWIARPRPHWLHHLDLVGCARAREQGGLCPGCVRNGFTAGTVFAAPPWRLRPAKVRVRIQRLRCLDGGERCDPDPRFVARWRMDRELFDWACGQVLRRPVKAVAELCGVDRGRLATLRDDLAERLNATGEWYVERPRP